MSGNPAHRPMSNLEREVELEPKGELVFVLRFDRSVVHRMCHASPLLLRNWTEALDCRLSQRTYLGQCLWPVLSHRQKG